MADGLTPSERMVASFCEQAFLRLWTHPNPKGKKGKELCDCLVVCGSEIVIISVKECNFKDTGDKVGWERWQRDAIDKSAAQIYGAERFLSKSTEVLRSDGRKIKLPPHDRRNYHRLSVSLGGQGEVPIRWGDLGKGFIHLCDEKSIEILFSELDTITDFTHFLSECEALTDRGALPMLAGGGIEDLVALYMLGGQSLQLDVSSGESPLLMLIQDDLWSGYSSSPEYETRRQRLHVSYLWDRLVEFYATDLLTDGMIDFESSEVTDDQHALAEMASQPREYRAALSEAFKELMEKPDLNVAARAVHGYGTTVFVFMLAPSNDREARIQELTLRCMVVRGKVPDATTVVGIATDRPGTSEIGYSSDIAYVHFPEWSDDQAQQVERIQDELGYFKDLGVERAEGDAN